MSDQTQMVTLGCRLNIHESHVMQDLATKAGLEKAIIINTCAVTSEAERQARQTIRRLRKDNPEAFIIVTGCAVQLRPEVFGKMPEVNRVLGNDIKLKASSFAKEFPYRVAVGPIERQISEDFPLLKKFEGKTRAFVQVQNGCDHRCAFCNIPLARGSSRSVPLGLVVQQVQWLHQSGVREVIFTGVDLTSYGKGLPGDLTLGRMLRRVLMQVPEMGRFRLSSLDSIEIDEELFHLLAHEPRLLPHLHLSLQAGSNAILRAMRRRHLREESIDFCRRLLKERPEYALGADFIVGFPGETEEMFQETMDLVDECSLSHLHVFPFSARPGTLAFKMEDKVPGPVIKERAARLRQKAKQALDQKLGQYLGQQVDILMEENNTGYTKDFLRVAVQNAGASSCVPGQILRVTIQDLAPQGLVGFLDEADMQDCT